MKRKATLIFSFFILIAGFVYAQDQENNLKCSIEFNQFITGSGFASGTELYFKLNSNNKKSIAFGAFFDTEFKKVTGISFHHEIILCREKAILNDKIKPHLFYNFIYRKTTIPELGPDLKSTGDLATYTLLEHHIGMGIKLSLLKKFYLDCDLGYGIYLGSIRKPTAFNPITGEVRGSNGLGMILQVGVGYCLF